MSEVRNWLAAKLVETLDCEPAEVRDQALIGADLGADSLDVMKMVWAAEYRFNISIDDGTITEDITFAAAVTLLERLVQP